jgi:hypothetical protein
MRLNIEAINQLIKDKFRNNKSFFADEIKVDNGYLSGVLNEKKTSYSNKVCNAVIVYCEKNNLNYKDYIFLE